MSEHAPRESAIETADPDASATATVGIVGAILLIVVVAFVQGLYGSASRSEQHRKAGASAPAELVALRSAQEARLHATAWVDKKNGFVAIPIERAMDLLIADPNPAAPIVLPEPAEAPR